MSEQVGVSRMRVRAYFGPGETRSEVRPVPVPAVGEVLLRVRVCGLCGTDLFKFANGTVAVGAVLGHEIVGDVVGLGEGVDSIREGDRVVVPHHVACGSCALCRRGSPTMCAVFRENLLDPGGFSEYVTVGQRAVDRAMRIVPPHVSDEAAVFFEPAACVLRGIERSALSSDGVAVVLGAGSMGLLHVLVLRSERSSVRTLVVDPVEERRRIAVSLGATVVSSPEDARDAIEDLSLGLGADAVFDTVGGARVLSSALELSRPGGSVVLFAHAPHAERSDFDLNAFFKAERRIVASYSGALEEQKTIYEAIIGGRLDASPLVTHHVSLDDLDRAVALVRRQQGLKILIHPDGQSSQAR